MSVMDVAETVSFAYVDLEYAPKGFACDTRIGEDVWCPARATIDYRRRHEYEDHTYKCDEHAPAVPDVFRVYDVYFDWEPCGRDIHERRVVTGVIARGVNEALLLYRSAVNSSQLAGECEAAAHGLDDWNASVDELPQSVTEDDFLDYLDDAVRRDKALAPWFEDVLT